MSFSSSSAPELLPCAQCFRADPATDHRSRCPTLARANSASKHRLSGETYGSKLKSFGFLLVTLAETNFTRHFRKASLTGCNGCNSCNHLSQPAFCMAGLQESQLAWLFPAMLWLTRIILITKSIEKCSTKVLLSTWQARQSKQSVNAKPGHLELATV